MGQRPRHGCRADAKPTPSSAHSGVGAQAAQRGTREVFFDDWVLAAVYDRDRLGAAMLWSDPRSWRSSVRRCRCILASPPPSIASETCCWPGRRGEPVPTHADAEAPDPVLVEIVGGYLASVEMEVETAIGRTSRSPMIRDAHDYRAGIRPQSREADRPLVFRAGQPRGPRLSDGDDGSGDVFFHNDVYLSEGGIGHRRTSA